MTRNSRHRVIAAAAFLAAAPALAGCGAGFDAITNHPYAPTEALATEAKGISISQAFFLGPDSGTTIPAGAATPLYLSMVNTNQAPDTLVGIGVDPALGTAKVSAPVTLPVQTRVGVGKPTPTILIEGLKKPLSGGESIQVQLQFANAGLIPLTIPVITRSREFTSLPQAPGVSATPTPTPTSTPTPSTSASTDSTEDVGHSTDG
ncbi:copper chaperone PCu(A)C [Streptosporangium lutulentum]|uniref:Copper(I)-binding protein n=1 Tax=Streptosporangium lutulentum TaxID=1461250 RepID=A0ABT9QJI1_9ACTN|nr:copper chaperone PCu(A)C [Streptosporangium lutulentum]MDP9846908.1 copper(I)-binding protein [Streptosporangium lutulentum]